MNPPNGWGDYDSLVGLLHKAVAAVPDESCEWRATG